MALKNIAPFFLLALIFLFPVAAMAECTILLHGLARTKSSLSSLEKFLKTKKHYVVSVNYPSTKKKIEELAEPAINKALKKCRDGFKKKGPLKKINFVTHSMGGILLRYYLSKNQIKELNRSVMIAPPNKGSELVDKLSFLKPFSWLNGPAGKQLSTDKSSFVNSLGPVKFELGVIAGNKSLNPLYSNIIPGPDDGKVSVSSAKIKGMKDFIALPAGHTFIMNNKKAQEEVLNFLNIGEFKASKKKILE